MINSRSPQSDATDPVAADPAPADPFEEALRALVPAPPQLDRAAILEAAAPTRPAASPPAAGGSTLWKALAAAGWLTAAALAGLWANAEPLTRVEERIVVRQVPPPPPPDIAADAADAERVPPPQQTVVPEPAPAAGEPTSLPAFGRLASLFENGGSWRFPTQPVPRLPGGALTASSLRGWTEDQPTPPILRDSPRRTDAARRPSVETPDRPGSPRKTNDARELPRGPAPLTVRQFPWQELSL